MEVLKKRTCTAALASTGHDRNDHASTCEGGGLCLEGCSPAGSGRISGRVGGQPGSGCDRAGYASGFGATFFYVSDCTCWSRESSSGLLSSNRLLFNVLLLLLLSEID